MTQSTAAASLRSLPGSPGTRPPAPPAPQPGDPVAGEPLAGDPAPAAPPVRPRWRRRGLPALLLLAVLAVAGWQGMRWWTEGRFLVSTDDAYLQSDMAIIAPKIAGYVATVPVAENQRVAKGEPILTLDDGDLQLALRSAEARLATQRAGLDRFDAQIAAARQQIAQARAQQAAADARLAEARADFGRVRSLNDRGVASRARLESALASRDTAAADLTGSAAGVASASANVAVLQAQRAEAERQLQELEITRDRAARDLGFTVLRAPFDGVVGNKAVQVGDYVTPGERLAALAPLRRIYVEANFKETDLAAIRVGQTARVAVDAAPDRPLTGRVVSISPATGSIFSLLPPENATGNFTKITQRVPVRIEIAADGLDGQPLHAGLSAVVAVDTRTGPAPQAASLH